MLDGSDRPKRSHIAQQVFESNLIDLGADRAFEALSVALEKTFPLPRSKPDERIESLLRTLARLESR